MPIKLVAVGGGASNALNHIIRTGGIDGHLIAVNTDVQDLSRSKAGTRLQIGAKVTKGLGSCGDPDIGRAAALADAGAIRGALSGAQLVIVVVGLGGGTGSGGAPVICGIARDLGAEVVVIEVQPLPFEGRPRRANADAALVALDAVVPGRVVHAVPVVSPDERLDIVGMFARMNEAIAAEARIAIAQAHALPAPGPV